MIILSSRVQILLFGSIYTLLNLSPVLSLRLIRLHHISVTPLNPTKAIVGLLDPPPHTHPGGGEDFRYPHWRNFSLGRRSAISYHFMRLSLWKNSGQEEMETEDGDDHRCCGLNFMARKQIPTRSYEGWRCRIDSGVSRHYNLSIMLLDDTWCLFVSSRFPMT